MIDIRGINKAELLVDLYNKAHQVEVDRLQPSILFTIDGAEDLLKQTTSFDELYGRVLNVDLSNDLIMALVWPKVLLIKLDWHMKW